MLRKYKHNHWQFYLKYPPTPSTPWLGLMAHFQTSPDTDLGDKGPDVPKVPDDDAKSDAGSETSSVAPVSRPPPPVVRGYEPTPLQRAFQPGSTPVQLSHRFMVSGWAVTVVVGQGSLEGSSSVSSSAILNFLMLDTGSSSMGKHVINFCGINLVVYLYMFYMYCCNSSSWMIGWFKNSKKS